MPRAARGFDFYETPAAAVEAILPHLPCAVDVLDPCAGRGAILSVVQKSPAARGIGPSVRGFEIDPSHGTRPNVYQRDALEPETWGLPELVVMNPPFNRALEFVERALVEVQRGGTVAALLRLGFLESAKRSAFHASHPSDVYVLARRPSFTGGRTDNAAYAWFLWGPGRGGRWSVLGGAS
jgi:hypothetical protein